MENKARLLEFTTRLVYSLDGLSSQLKVYWSHVLSVIFSDSLQESQIQFNESQAAAKQFKNQAAMLESAKSLSKEELVYSLGLIALLAERAELTQDNLEAKRIWEILQTVLSGTDCGTEDESVSQAHNDFRIQLNRFEKRPLVKIPARIWPITLDYAFRWISLAVFNAGVYDANVLSGANVVVIPFAVLVITAIVSMLDKRYNRDLLQKYGGASQFRLSRQVSSDQYTLLAFFIGSGVLVNYLTSNDSESGWFFGFLTLAGFMLYFTLCLRFFGVGRINERDLASQVALANSQKKFWGADENDEAIVVLETKLNSVTSRLEAYVVESALFGALSFSGFLQIIANNIISLKDMDRFAGELKGTARFLVAFDWTGFILGLDRLGSDKSLFCLISVETLVCSIFFLAVIASRLQFSDVADKIREALNLAKAYNEKEEALIDREGLTEKAEGRLRELNKKVGQQLEKAVETTEELKPVIQYMQYFRNAGIVVFLVLLVNSSLFITGALGWAFTVLGLATWLYFRRDAIGRSWQAAFLGIKILFARTGKWLFTAAAIAIVLSYLLRIGLGWGHTDLLRFLGIVTLGIYFFTWMVFTTHFDPRFGEIDPAEDGRVKSRGWRIAKNLFGPTFLMLGLGVGFKIFRLNGANEMIMISLTSLAFLSYALGYFLSKIKWLGIAASIGLSTTAIGILFKVLHLTGANEMLLLGLTSFIPAFCIVIIWRRMFHKLFIQCYVVLLVANIYFSSGILTGSGGIRSLLETGYEHKTYDVSEIQAMIGELYDLNLGVDTKEEIAVLDDNFRRNDQYVKRYGNKVGWTDAYRFTRDRYSEIAYTILDSAAIKHKGIPADALQKELLEVALRAARQAARIDSVFNMEFTEVPTNVELEADILLKLDRREEAIDVLNRTIEPTVPLSIRERLVKKLGALKNAPPA